MTHKLYAKRLLKNVLTTGTPVALSVLLCACGIPAAKDFGGRWKPVNRYDKKPVEIPLSAPYTYQAAPMDGTLKAMLTRWASDTGLELIYTLGSDFTLPKSASVIHTTEVREAINQLGSVFAENGLDVRVDGPSIVVTAINIDSNVKPSP